MKTPMQQTDTGGGVIAIGVAVLVGLFILSRSKAQGDDDDGDDGDDGDTLAPGKVTDLAVRYSI